MLTYFWKARPAVSDLPRWIHSDLMLVLSVGLYGLFPPLFFPASCQLLSSLSLEIRFRPCFDIVSGRFESSPERPSWWESSHCFQQSSSSMFPCTPLGACLKCATKDVSKPGTNRNRNLVRREKNTGITVHTAPPKTNIALETLLEYDFSFCEGEGRWGSDPICWTAYRCHQRCPPWDLPWLRVNGWVSGPWHCGCCGKQRKRGTEEEKSFNRDLVHTIWKRWDVKRELFKVFQYLKKYIWIEINAVKYCLIDMFFFIHPWKCQK